MRSIGIRSPTGLIERIVEVNLMKLNDATHQLEFKGKLGNVNNDKEMKQYLIGTILGFLEWIEL